MWAPAHEINGERLRPNEKHLRTATTPKRKAPAAYRGSGWDEAGYEAFTCTTGQYNQPLKVIQKKHLRYIAPLGLGVTTVT